MTIKNIWVAPSTTSDGSTLWFILAAGHSNFHCIDIARTKAEANDMIKHIETGAKATNPYFDNEEEQQDFSKQIEH